MTHTLSFLLFLFLGNMIYRLMGLRTAQNKIYLPYFIGHVALILLMVFIGFLSVTKLDVFPVEINILIKQLSLILLLLFSKAVFLNTPPKVPKVIILIFLTSFTIFVCNFFGYRFLPPSDLEVTPGYTGDSLTILYRDTTRFVYYSSLIIGAFIAYDIRVTLKRFKELMKKEKAFLRYLTFYVSFIIFNYLIFISRKFIIEYISAESLTFLSRILLMIEVLLPLIINHFLTSITKLDFSKRMGSSLVHENEVLTHLIQLITSNKLFLEPDFSLPKMQFYSNLSADTIRNAIKASNFVNFKAFLNHHRIVYAVALIDGGYLEKKTIHSLSLDSGFKSSVTFFRVFKDQKKLTPLAYSTQNL